MFLAQDANFRLKARFRNTKVEDVCLSPGWGAFVEHKTYLEHVSRFANQEEVRNILYRAALSVQTSFSWFRSVHARDFKLFIWRISRRCTALVRLEWQV